MLRRLLGAVILLAASPFLVWAVPVALSADPAPPADERQLRRATPSPTPAVSADRTLSESRKAAAVAFVQANPRMAEVTGHQPLQMAEVNSWWDDPANASLGVGMVVTWSVPVNISAGLPLAQVLPLDQRGASAKPFRDTVADRSFVAVNRVFVLVHEGSAGLELASIIPASGGILPAGPDAAGGPTE